MADEFGDEENGVFTEVENESFFDRLGSSCAGICIGLMLFIGAFPLLWWNEGRAVDTYNAINEGRKIYVPIDPSTINSMNDQALIYATGYAAPSDNDNVTDVDFGISFSSKTKLVRTVEIYQWYENKRTTKKKNVGGGTTTTTEYTYDKRWETKLVDSTNFKRTGYNNPQFMPYQGSSFYPSSVMLGAFTMPNDFIDQISDLEPIGGSLNTSVIPSNNALFQTFDASKRFDYPNGFYFGNSTSFPSIGDTRITYKTANGGQVSILAKQDGNTFSPYIAKSSASIYRLDRGTINAEQMFQNAKDDNKALTMILRIVGAIVMSIGIGLVLGPLEVMADIIPCIGDLVGGAIACVAGIIGCTLSLIVIGIAWVANRPIILGIGAAGAVIVGILVYMGIQRKNNK